MSEQIKDGGPAFPVHPVAHERSDMECAALSGMTLRDYFAAHAPITRDLMSLKDHCAYRYRYADAMLRAREVKP